MENFENLSREDLIKYLEFLSGLTMAVDGLWFVAAEKATDFDRALEMDTNVWSWYAPLLVKRIRRNFPVDGTGLEALKQIIRHDPMWWTVDVAITEDTPRWLVFEVRDCPALVAMEKMNRKRLTCEPVEQAYLKALAAAVDPDIKVEVLKLPPRTSPTEICCSWAFHVEP
jgi:hypothetical protein